MSPRTKQTKPLASVRVLIGFADTWPAPEVTWSLARAGAQIYAYKRRASNAPLQFSRFARVKSVAAPEEDVDLTLAELGALIETLHIDAVLPVDDESIWLLDRLPQVTATVVGPSGEAAVLALDKRCQLATAAEIGLATPATVSVEPGTRPDQELECPAVVKRALAVARVGRGIERGAIRYCRSSREIDAALAHDFADRPALIQPALAGTGEGVFGLCTPDGPRHLSSHRRIRMVKPEGSGSSACESAPVDDDCRSAIVPFCAKLGTTGMFMLEFLRTTDGKPYFMELNARPWGSLGLTRRLGFEYPAWAVADALGLSDATRRDPPYADIEARHLGRELMHLLRVFRGPPTGYTGHWPTRLESCRAVMLPRRGAALLNWCRKDPLVLFADTWATFSRHG